MRSAGNFHPEWGYLAPAPSFIRTARMVLVAAAVGATAGAGVVFSLLDRPTDVDEMSVAARTLARPVEAASSTLNTLQAAPVNAQAAVPSRTAPSSTTVRAADSPASESHMRSTVQAPQSAATLTKAAAATGGAPAKASQTPPSPPPAAVAVPAVSPAPAQKKVAAKKHHVAPRYALRGGVFSSGDYYGATSGLYMNGASGGSYRKDRWGGYGL